MGLEAPAPHYPPSLGAALPSSPFSLVIWKEAEATKLRVKERNLGFSHFVPEPTLQEFPLFTHLLYFNCQLQLTFNIHIYKSLVTGTVGQPEQPLAMTPIVAAKPDLGLD